MSVNIDKEELKRRYETSRISAKNLAKEYGVVSSTVLKKLKEVGAKIRKRGNPYYYKRDIK